MAATVTGTEYKDPQKVIKRMKPIVFRGGQALNPMPNGNCRTLKYQYQKNSIANFIASGSIGATAVIRHYERSTDNRTNG